MYCSLPPCTNDVMIIYMCVLSVTCHVYYLYLVFKAYLNSLGDGSPCSNLFNLIMIIDDHVLRCIIIIMMYNDN